MNDEFVQLLEILKNKQAKNFIGRTKDKVAINTKINQVVRDLSWVEKLEETIPYIDDVVRNPRSFIIYEEKILPVEKTKRVTKESIKHLAQNTSLIQSVDEDGTVQPLKLLNVFKEETIDLYENRFVYSLLFNVKSFLNEQLLIMEDDITSRYEKTLAYNSETDYKGDNTTLGLVLKTSYRASETERLKEEDINQRIRSLDEIFTDYLGSVFAKEMFGSVPVKSPLRKTNAILKDNNLKMLVSLWEFLESYNKDEAVKKIETDKVDEPLDISDKLKLTTYLDYYFLHNMSIKELDKKDKLSVPYLRSIIEVYVSEYDISESEFKKLINTEYRLAKDRKQKEYFKIKEIYDEVVTNYNKNRETALKFLK